MLDATQPMRMDGGGGYRILVDWDCEVAKGGVVSRDRLLIRHSLVLST